MTEFILALALSFSTIHTTLGTDVHINTSATYQKPFESLEACEAAAPDEMRLMTLHFIRFTVADVDINYHCLPTGDEES